MSIRVRPQDRDLAQTVVPTIEQKYAEAVGKEVHLKVDPENALPQNSCGGIQLYANHGRIKIDNRLEARLELIAAQLIPQIRTALFGRNANRKFTD